MCAPSPSLTPALRPTRARLRGGRSLRAAIAVALTLGASAGARAQTLLELYDAAHGYDATYLSARALAESVPYRIEQSEALLRPSASLGSSASRVERSSPPCLTFGL